VYAAEINPDLHREPVENSDQVGAALARGRLRAAHQVKGKYGSPPTTSST
jgi:hypothetical protein